MKSFSSFSCQFQLPLSIHQFIHLLTFLTVPHCPEYASASFCGRSQTVTRCSFKWLGTELHSLLCFQTTSKVSMVSFSFRLWNYVGTTSTLFAISSSAGTSGISICPTIRWINSCSLIQRHFIWQLHWSMKDSTSVLLHSIWVNLASAGALLNIAWFFCHLTVHRVYFLNRSAFVALAFLSSWYRLKKMADICQH